MTDYAGGPIGNCAGGAKQWASPPRSPILPKMGASQQPLTRIEKRDAARIASNLACRVPFWVFIIWLAAAQSVSAQSITLENPGQRDCSSEEVKGFDFLPGPWPGMRTNFLLKPKANAESAEIKTHIVYSRILESYAALQVYKSLPQCLLSANVDGASLDIDLSLTLGRGPDASKECSLKHCARAFSNLLQSAAMGQLEFSTIVDAIVLEFRRKDSVDLRFPGLAAELAAEEALRHIYPPDSRARVVLGTTAEDYRNTNFERFFTWFVRQQNALRDSPGTLSPLPPLSISPTPEDDDCVPVANIRVGELDIDHHGWGHQAILLVKSGYKIPVPTGIENDTLRAVCSQDRSSLARLSEFPWNEIARRIQCAYRLVDRDRWLILYSKQNGQTAADMRQYAQSIANVFQAGMCVRPGTRLLVVNFLGQR